jgi:hypothetical protein
MQDRWYIGYLICILCFAVMAWSFYPGLMSPDSIANLADARQGTFTDVNAPLMAYLWRWLDGISAGPGLMFLLVNAIFWTACALFWKAAHRESFGLGLALVLFALLPHILAQTPVVWKDVGMGASLFLAAALIYYAKKTGSKLAMWIVPFPLFYAYAVRLNAFPAVLPIAIWAGTVDFRVFDIKGRRLPAAVAGIGYFLVLSFSVYFVNEQLTEGKTVYPFQQVYLYDLAALSVRAGESKFPEYVSSGENFSLDSVRERYNSRSVSDLIYPDIPNAGDRPVLKLTDDANEIAELKTKWWEAVGQDPGGYLGHRWRVFAQLTGLGKSVTAPYWEPGFSSSPPEYRAEENIGTRGLMKYFGAFRRPFPQTFFFRGFIWLILCGFFLYKSLRRGLRDDWDLVFVLSSSALLFVFAYFPTAPSTEFRYLFWPAIASALTVIFGIYMLRKEKRGEAREDNLQG